MYIVIATMWENFRLANGLTSRGISSRTADSLSGVSLRQPH